MKKSVLIIAVIALGLSADLCLWCGPAQKLHEKMWNDMPQRKDLFFY